MGWTNEEPVKNKKGMDTSSKILLGIIACIAFIIILIFILLLYVQKTNFLISVDGEEITNVTKTSLLATIDDITYINIKEFAKLVGYEYHEGEYKKFTIEKDKCYVQGPIETATFYLNDNKVNKLLVNQIESDYESYTVENTVKMINDEMYASINTISVAFNVSISKTEKSFSIYTLDYLIKVYNTKVKGWGYTDIIEQDFENKKALLYGYLIVKKEDGLYKIIDNENTKEIVADKYTEIKFSEITQEFLVTNSLGQVGIINLDGTTKIEPTYESIEIFDKELDLYLIKKNNKYGLIKSGNIAFLPAEYDNIGLKKSNIENTSGEKQKLILDTLIPVCKESKWGAVDTDGELIIKIEYDNFGCNLTSVELNDTTKEIEPLLVIERCKGIVVNNGEKYGLIDINGKELVPVAADSIYSIKNIEDENKRYFMIHKNKEFNVIERLIAVGLLEEEKEDIKENSTINNTIVTNQINNNIVVQNTANNTTNNIIENSTVEANSNTTNNVVVSNEV